MYLAGSVEAPMRGDQREQRAYILDRPDATNKKKQAPPESLTPTTHLSFILSPRLQMALAGSLATSSGNFRSSSYTPLMGSSSQGAFILFRITGSFYAGRRTVSESPTCKSFSSIIHTASNISKSEGCRPCWTAPSSASARACSSPRRPAGGKRRRVSGPASTASW